MKYKLFIADFDFTLGIAPDFIEEETVLAIKEYIKRGGIFVICSGRMYKFIKALCNKYGLEGVVVTYQGAMVGNVKTDEVLRLGGMDYKLASEVVREIQEGGMSPMAFIDDNLYYGEMTPFIDGYQRVAKVTGIGVGDLSKYVLDSKKTVLKVGGVSDGSFVESVRENLNKKYGGELIFNNGAPQILECINPKWSKGTAVQFLMDYYNISPEQTLAVGDSTNDIELLSGDWYTVAVGDGHEEVKKVAKEVTVPFKEQPVKVLLEKYCL